MKRVCIYLALGAGLTGCGAAAQTTSPYQGLHTNADPRITEGVQKLEAEKGAGVGVTVSLEGALAKGLGFSGSATLAGNGHVDFAAGDAQWSLGLPKTLGGGTFLARTVGEQLYLRLGGLGPSWVEVSPSEVGSLSHLGFLETLAVLVNPLNALGEASSTVGSAVALAWLDGARESAADVAACGNGVGQTLSGQVQVGSLPAIPPFLRGVVTSLLSRYQIRTANVGMTQGKVTSVSSAGTDLTIQDGFCGGGETQTVANPQGQIAPVTELTQTNRCLVGTWQMVGQLPSPLGGLLPGQQSGGLGMQVLPSGAVSFVFAITLANPGAFSTIQGEAYADVLSPPDFSNGYLGWAVLTSGVVQTQTIAGPPRTLVVTEPVGASGLVRSAFSCSGPELTVALPVGNQQPIRFARTGGNFLNSLPTPSATPVGS